MTLFSIKEPIMMKTILIPLVSSHGIISAAYVRISLRSPAFYVNYLKFILYIKAQNHSTFGLLLK
jgi:hypothetical protein